MPPNIEGASISTEDSNCIRLYISLASVAKKTTIAASKCRLTSHKKDWPYAIATTDYLLEQTAVSLTLLLHPHMGLRGCWNDRSS